MLGNVRFLLVLAMLLVPESISAKRSTDPLSAVRSVLKYWRKIYKTYHEEMQLGYCWADYILGLRDGLFQLPMVPEDGSTDYEAGKRTQEFLKLSTNSGILPNVNDQDITANHEFIKHERVSRSIGMYKPVRGIQNNIVQLLSSFKDTLYGRFENYKRRSLLMRGTGTVRSDHPHFTKERSVANLQGKISEDGFREDTTSHIRVKRETDKHTREHEYSPSSSATDLDGTRFRSNTDLRNVEEDSSSSINGAVKDFERELSKRGVEVSSAKIAAVYRGSSDAGDPTALKGTEGDNGAKYRRENSSLRRVKDEGLIADYVEAMGGASENSERDTSSPLKDQGQRSSGMIPQPRGPVGSILPTLTVYPVLVAVLRTLGMFVSVGRRVIDIVESVKVLSCTKEYLLAKSLQWIDS